MKRQIQVYIEGTKIDLFDDEQIVVNSTIQNISDISKIFCDFSQSFTIPATNTNNKIFHHWYNSDVYKYNDVQFNVQTRKSAKIDVNLTPFRSGKIELEKVNIKNGKPESYQLAFYGDITTLKDLFGEDKLSDLDLSALDHNYTGTEVINRISDDSTDYDVRYPLISSKDLWSWEDGGSHDITTTTGVIAYTDLFPAVKVSKLFEAIEAEYTIDFQGNFLNDQRFKKLFLWCKNLNTNSFVSQPKKLDLTGPLSFPNVAPLVNQDPFNYTTDTLTLQWDGNSQLNSGTLLNSNWHLTHPLANIFLIVEKIKLSILPSTLTATIYIDMYVNNILTQTQEIAPLPATASGLYIDWECYAMPIDTTGQAKVFHWEVRASQAMTITGKVNYQQCISYISGAGVGQYEELWRSTSGNAVTLTGTNYINNYVPDIKVSDFFTGILKMFNLTCYSGDGSIYNVESIEEWYNVGDLYDTTKYTDIESIEMSRLPLYKKIAFEYQPSNSFLNKQFHASHQREYGNMVESFTYDGGEYKVDVPFENLLGQRFRNASGVFSNTQVHYALDENYNPYIPKPCLFYMSDKQTTSIKINDGTTNQTVTNYMLFGQDMYANNFTPYSLNFRNEISSFLLIVNPNGLYAAYYANYLMNMYQVNNRLVTLKSIFPVSLLSKLQLNDRLKIRDKRYIINSMKSNINSGEVDLTLIMDFRPVNPINVIPANPSANCVDVPITLYNNVCSATITTTTAGVTITPSSITSNQIISVCVPVNANSKGYIVDESNDPTAPAILFKLISTEDDVPVITEQSATQNISLLVTQTYCNGAVLENTIIIQQP